MPPPFGDPTGFCADIWDTSEASTQPSVSWPLSPGPESVLESRPVCWGELLWGLPLGLILLGPLGLGVTWARTGHLSPQPRRCRGRPAPLDRACPGSVWLGNLPVALGGPCSPRRGLWSAHRTTVCPRALTLGPQVGGASAWSPPALPLIWEPQQLVGGGASPRLPRASCH